MSHELSVCGILGVEWKLWLSCCRPLSAWIQTNTYRLQRFCLQKIDVACCLFSPSGTHTHTHTRAPEAMCSPGEQVIVMCSFSAGCFDEQVLEHSRKFPLITHLAAREKEAKGKKWSLETPPTSTSHYEYETAYKRRRWEVNSWADNEEPANICVVGLSVGGLFDCFCGCFRSLAETTFAHSMFNGWLSSCSNFKTLSRAHITVVDTH